MSSKTSAISASRNNTALGVVLAENGGALPDEGILAIDLVPGTPIDQRTLNMAILKLSIHMTEDYTPERDPESGEIIPNRVTELVEEASRRGWTHERTIMTIERWLFSVGKRYDKWRPAEVINFEASERLYGYDWYLSQENRRSIEIYRVEGFSIPFFKPVGGRALPPGFTKMQTRTGHFAGEETRDYSVPPELRALLAGLGERNQSNDEQRPNAH